MILSEQAEPNAMYGIALKVVSVAVFTAMAALIKLSATHVPAGEAVFFRSFFAIPPIIAWLAFNRQLKQSLHTANPLSHFWRGLIGVSAMFLGFTALGLLPFPEVITIGYAAPLFATLLAAMFLGERIRLFRMTAVFAGLMGVILVLLPRLTVLQSGGADSVLAAGAVIALMGALFAALAQVFVRKLVTEEHTATIVIYFSLFAALLSFATVPFGWVWPTPGETALLVTAGILGGLGQIFLTESYRHAETAVIASFEYTSMLLALFVGYVFFDEAPTSLMLAGAALVVAAGIAIAYRERQLGIERAKARKVMTPQG